MDIEWRDVKDFDHYQVSNTGFVRSKDRRVKRSIDKKSHFLEGIIMGAWPNQCGFLMLRLSKNGKRYTRTVHRLVAEAFITNNKKLARVYHENRDRYDNRACNLKWGKR